ncbi:acyltransferase [Siphonobacter sp. SORGH_AS_0500]|uniref:acyltransferase family protein n=1 Tax=Siphonobacter sp. SORGH_AS_0500 TaxID=1864824 RepID=UPI000CC79D5F|nr:acyltransferase [Siphonobacter sp. SORGH_AS_0500]PKK37424.1 acyltransferase [Siphonobacter sp. SORGH_AS_0500]
MKENRFNGLDHLRAVAIILVWMYHYRAFRHPDWLDTIGSYGWTGVDLFFVLSGFLISGQLFREIREYGTVFLKTFFTKRFFRIIPPFVFTLLLYVCFPWFREREALPPLWRFLTFTQNYGLDVINKGTFSHAWSLCIEEQFYLLLPFSLLLLLKTGWLSKLKYILMVLPLISIALRSSAWTHFVVPALESDHFWKLWYMHIYYPTHTRLDSLAIGVLIGFLYEYSVTFKQLIHSKGVLFFFAGIATLAFAFWVCKDQYSQTASVFGFTWVGLAYGLLVSSAVSNSCFLSGMSSRVTRQLADLSFAIYLSHKGIIHLIQVATSPMNLSENQLMILCLIGCLAAGLVYRYTLERPSSWLKNRLLNQNIES